MNRGERVRAWASGGDGGGNSGSVTCVKWEGREPRRVRAQVQAQDRTNQTAKVRAVVHAARRISHGTCSDAAHKWHDCRQSTHWTGGQSAEHRAPGVGKGAAAAGGGTCGATCEESQSARA